MKFQKTTTVSDNRNDNVRTIDKWYHEKITAFFFFQELFSNIKIRNKKKKKEIKRNLDNNLKNFIL